MSKFRSIFLVVCISFVCSGLLQMRAADKNYYFKSLDVQNGLSQNTVYSILQDRLGFLWIATKDGLNRFDGTNVRIYKHVPSDSNSLRSNFITALYEDGEGNIWVGTDSGLDIYLPQLERFIHVTVANDGHSHNITSISSSPDGEVWVAVETLGIVSFTNGSFEPVMRLEENATDPMDVSALHVDNSGHIFVGTVSKGLYLSEDGLRSLSHFSELDHGSAGLDLGNVSAILSGPYNTLYLASLTSGVWQYNMTSGQLNNIMSKDRNGGQIRCRSLLIYNRNLLAGTESGLFIYDLDSGRSTQLRSSYYDQYSLSANSVYSMCEDNEGGVWIGTYFGGVNYYSPEFAAFEKYYPEKDSYGLKGKRVREICTDSSGTMWIGTEDSGLYSFNPETKLFTQFEQSLEFNNIHGLCPIGDELWVGTISRGIRVIDPLKGRILRKYENTEERKPLIDNNVYDIYRTRAGDIFVGCQQGLMLYSKDTDQFETISTLAGRHVYDINEDVQGNLWVATYSDGVWRYRVDDKSWKVYRHRENDPTTISHDMVVSVFVDSKGTVWLTTEGGGVCRYRPETDDFQSFTTSNKLPSNVVYQIVEDKTGQFWVTTGNGLLRIDSENPESNNIYRKENGLLSNQFNYKSSYITDQGVIYLGSIHGLIAFNPIDIKEANFRPSLIASDLMIFGQRQAPGLEGSPLSSSMEFTNSLELPYNHNSLSFRLVAPNFVSPHAHQIEYKLDDYDDIWHSGEVSPLVSYSNLKYGHYLFHARFVGDDADAYTLAITVKPPFYLTFAAKLLYVLLAMLLAYMITTFILKRKDSLYKIELARMEQEKERAIYDSKLEFFTNVTHEIKTPLSLISGPLECILDRDDINDEIRDELLVMKQNSERLTDLTRQLLDFKKVESSDYSLDFARCNVSQLLRDTFVRFTVSARQKGLEMSLSADGDDIFADVNREALTKIISNLLNNGLKYAGSFLRVSARMSDADHFQIVTENDGELVPDNMKEEIFKLFVRSRSTEVNNAPTGTGIGLVLARSLATLHHGTLAMEPGHDDNVFVLTLPVNQASSTSPGLQEEEDIDMTAFSGTGSNPVVLVVEDEPQMRAFVAKHLSPKFDVMAASNGRQALEMMAGANVELVVSDVMMPEMDGIELCRSIKSDLRFSHVPVILLTAKTNTQSKLEGIEVGADAYIEKPFSVKLLIASINNLIEGRKLLKRQFAQSTSADTMSIAFTEPDKEFMARLNEVIELNYSNSEFNMDDMAADMGMSRASFYRKIGGVMNMTPNDYLRLVRLKKAAALLSDGVTRVNEACYLVGFSSPSYFAKCFQKQFGLTPKDFSEKSISKKSPKK